MQNTEKHREMLNHQFLQWQELPSIPQETHPLPITRRVCLYVRIPIKESESNFSFELSKFSSNHWSFLIEMQGSENLQWKSIPQKMDR